MDENQISEFLVKFDNYFKVNMTAIDMVKENFNDWVSNLSYINYFGEDVFERITKRFKNSKFNEKFTDYGTLCRVNVGDHLGSLGMVLSLNFQAINKGVLAKDVNLQIDVFMASYSIQILVNKTYVDSGLLTIPKHIFKLRLKEEVVNQIPKVLERIVLLNMLTFIKKEPLSDELYEYIKNNSEFLERYYSYHRIAKSIY